MTTETKNAPAPIQIGPITRRLTSSYRRASDTDKANGRLWYQDARAICQALQIGTSYTLEQIAHAFAILSPRISYRQNVDSITTLVSAHSKNASADSIVCAAFGANVRRAYRVLSDPAERARGPKTNAFARAILGDESAVTLDVWMYRAAVSRDNVTRVAERRAIDTACRRAARIVGESARDLQAIVWIETRGASD